MDFLQNHFVPQSVPQQMAHTALQYTQPSSFVGKVFRIRPNIYVFVCEYCVSEHQSIDSFLRHTESHFQCNETSNAITSAMTHVHPNQNPSSITADINSSGSTVAPYPVQLQQSGNAPIGHESDYMDEVYEITDLGYDFDGNYPNAENIDAIPIDDHCRKPSKPKKKQLKSKMQHTKPKIQRSKQKNLVETVNDNPSNDCPFCVRNFTTQNFLRRHLDTAHAKIFRKIDCQKKSYKCKICEKKFPKADYTLEDAHEHLKIHYKK